jgi:hypothetical protein
MANQNDIALAYQRASIKTANDLRTIATAGNLQQLSRLSLPEIDHLTDEISRVVPAGNVPGIVLGGLARLTGRQVSTPDAQKQIGMLFKGARQMLDKAVYGTFFAGPAAVLYGYQQLLRLAGKDVESAFPNGTWQFYLEFALREDSARHATETTGFHERLVLHGIHLSEADMLAAWVLASAYAIQQLPETLANEWRERVTTKLLAELAEQFSMADLSLYQDLYAEWEKIRPYQRGADAGQEDYPRYRKRIFEVFIKPYVDKLPPDAQQTYRARLWEQQRARLNGYREQMSWLAYLEPGDHNETRTPYSFEDAFVGVIWQGRYYLLPASAVLDPHTVRSNIAALTQSSARFSAAALDEELVNVRRGEQSGVRQLVDGQSQKELNALRHAPILINWDARDARQPLALIRQGKRGIGDHALTLFRTAESIVFDQSHIFFDGVWGAAVAEIMTNEALSWAVYLSQLPPPTPVDQSSIHLSLQTTPKVVEKARQLRIVSETGAESTNIRLGTIIALRKLLKQRSDLVLVTVNDLLLLYRGLHARLYTPSLQLRQRLETLAQDSNRDAQHAYQIILSELERLKGKNPAILIPLDASRNNPHERVFPTTFRNPLTDFYDYHLQCLNTLKVYKDTAHGSRGTEFQAFYDAQLNYLRIIAGFGELLTRYRNIALAGQSTSTASIKFLAHMPTALQKLLDAIPSQFDVLNEIIKGEEVFSNMGRVAKGSTLRRFITAKDDNEQKTLAWGVLTDDKGVLHLSLRDFRPHVTVLHSLGMTELAQHIAQDYLDVYAQGLNQYVSELRDIVIASRETQFKD